LVEDVDEMRLHVEQAKLEYREQAAGPRPDDEHVGLDRFNHASASRVDVPICREKRPIGIICGVSSLRGAAGKGGIWRNGAAAWRLSPNLLLRTRAGIETQPPAGRPRRYSLSPS